MYSIDELKEIISAIDNSSVTNLSIKSADGEKIVIKKEIITAQTSPVTTTVETNNKTTVYSNVETSQKDGTNEENFKVIKSPMVGVFYSSSSPEAKPFVQIGSKISIGDTVCIIEAMKLMNEVTADINGEIIDICVSNGDVVEYGQPLFKIK